MSLIRAARVFAFEVPDLLPDDTVAGTLCGVKVYVGELRRLSAAIQDKEENPDDQIILDFLKRRALIDAIRHRRLIANESLREAKEHVEAIAVRHGLRRRDNTPYGWEWV